MSVVTQPARRVRSHLRSPKSGLVASVADDRAFLETARRLAGMEIAYVGHPQFSAGNTRRWLEQQRPAPRELQPPIIQSTVGVAFVPALVEAPLLTPEEERSLFLTMNYRRYQAERARRRINPLRPARSVVAEVQNLLAESVQLRNRIAEANVRLIVAVARKLSQSVDQMSELIGEGMLPLLRAVELFDVDRGYRFSTYATWAVRNQMIRNLKRQRGLRESLRCDLEHGWEDAILSPADTDDAPMNLPPESFLSDLMHVLTDRERQVIDRRFGLRGQPTGQSLSEIAGQVGLSKERVRQLVLAGLDKMRSAAQSGAVRWPDGWACVLTS